MRIATSSDIPAVRTVLARAYTNDPLMQWIFPDDVHRQDATAVWLGLFVEHYVMTGRAQVVDDAGVDAVAAWRMPDDPSPAPGALPNVGGLLAALIGADRAEVVGTGLHAISSVTPTTPFAYLQFLAVHPDQQRRGLGTALLETGSTEAHRRGLGVHLETTNPDNLPFYEAHGFAVTDSLRLPLDGPELWAMYRPGVTE